MNVIHVCKRESLPLLTAAILERRPLDHSWFCATDIKFDQVALEGLLYAALDKFHGKDRFSKSELDAYLAPRLHSALRMNRKMASDHLVWAWVASVPMVKFLERRWPLSNDDGDEKKAKNPEWRYVGRNLFRNGVSRLWWAAELLRSGPDYRLVEDPIKAVYAFQFVSELEYSWHREFTRAFARVCLDLDLFEKGSEVVKDLSKRVNAYAKMQAIEFADDETDDAVNSQDEIWLSRQPALAELTAPVAELVGPQDGKSREHVEERLYTWIAKVATELKVK